ncbi:MAG TPA: hypothetical protein DCG47_04190 [Spirochaetaceae bacterium]|nr:hypothetical protein [Spirochaetaceae bacterium]
MSKGSKKTLLLVEDEPILAMSAKAQLENYGYAVKTVTTGEQAVAAVKTLPEIDLVLMDINLGPGIDGTEAAEIILKEEDIPIVFVSSHSEREVVEKTEKITSYGYVVKGSSITVLDASIKMAFKLFDVNQAMKLNSQKDHESAQLLQNIMDNIPGMVFWKDSNSIYKGCSIAFARSAGLELTTEIVGKTDYDLPWKDHEADNYRKADRIVLDEGIPRLHILETQRTAEGSTIWLDTSKIPLFDTERNVNGLLGVSLDITEQKAKEEALRISKETSDMLLNVAAEIIISEDFQGNILLLNQSGHTMLGYRYPELVGKNFLDLCLPEELKAELHEYFKSLAHVDAKAIVTHENEVVTRNGERRIIYWHNALIRDKDGKPIGIFSSGEDVTERKRAEEALRESEEKFSTIFKESPYPAMLIDTDNGCFFDVNMEMQRSVEFSREELIGKSAAQLGIILPETELQTKRLLSAYGQYSDFEVSIRTKSGKVQFGMATGRIIVINKHAYLIQTLVDITERKKTEEALEERNSILNALLDSLPIGVFMVEAPSGKPIVANEIAKQLLGRGILPDVDANNLGEVYQAFLRNSDTMYPLDEMPIIRALRGEKSHIEDMDVKKADGTRSLLEVFGSPVIDRGGRVRAGLVSFNDITERKKSEQRIVRLLNEKEIILKEVNHRIKNNMNIMGSLLKLQSDNYVSQETKSILLDAEGRLKSMMVLYDKLYQSGTHDELSMKDYVPSLLREIVDVFPNSESIKLSLKIDDFSLDTKFLSPLGIILNELITNSMKYACMGDDGVIAVNVIKNGGRVYLDYQDSGIGLPESLTFENSTGFGLQLVKMLVEQINGTIQIEREKGTKYAIEFKV